MFQAVPPCTVPTETTTGLRASIPRLWMVWIAVMIAAAVTMGSSPCQGIAACDCLPVTVTWK